MTIKVDIIIVGAGLIGSALALSLAKRKPNLCIAIVERGPQLLDNHFPNQRVVALGRVATETLDDVGILPKLGASFANPYEKMFDIQYILCTRTYGKKKDQCHRSNYHNCHLNTGFSCECRSCLSTCLKPKNLSFNGLI